jgi:hypothetical protein
MRNVGAGVSLGRACKHSVICSLTFTSKAHPIHESGRERRYLSVTDAPGLFIFFSLGDPGIIGLAVTGVESATHECVR